MDCTNRSGLRSSAAPARRIALVATLLLLLGCLTGCATVPEVRLVRVDPPARYLAPCPVPEPESARIAYLVESYPLLLQGALARCNAQLACARAWVAGGEVPAECGD